MAEIRNARVDSFGGSSKVIPISDGAYPPSEGQLIETSSEMQDPGTIAGMSVDGEYDPHDSWLPITESRNGTTLTAALHLLCSGIGLQVFSLPVAFVSLGWSWGIICLTLVFAWQLYTTWLLVNLHESTPVTGIRYSRFLHLSIVAFGQKFGKLLAMFPTMYLAAGTCVMYIIAGGATMELFFKSICGSNLACKARTLTGAEWFLVFICIAIFMAEFFPNLKSLTPAMLIGSITALAFCTMLWILSLTKGRLDDQVDAPVVSTDDASKIRNVFTSLETIALAFRGHNLVLEIQGTLPSNQKQSSNKSMWRGVAISYIFIAICMYPLAIVGHWAYGDKINGGILAAFTKYHQNSTSKYTKGAMFLIIIINYLCTFQIYAIPIFDNITHVYVAKKNAPCPRWIRSAIKVFFGGLTYFVAVAFSFLPSLGAVIGAAALPLTLVYPCFMWIAIKKPQRFGRMWWLNQGLGSTGAVLSVMFFAAALWSLIDHGLEANFFKPK